VVTTKDMPSKQAPRGLTTLPRRWGRFPQVLVRAVGDAWRALLIWRCRRAAVLLLRSLDQRILRQIGVDPRDIEGALDAWPERKGYAARPGFRP